MKRCDLGLRWRLSELFRGVLNERVVSRNPPPWVQCSVRLERTNSAFLNSSMRIRVHHHPCIPYVCASGFPTGVHRLCTPEKPFHVCIRPIQTIFVFPLRYPVSHRRTNPFIRACERDAFPQSVEPSYHDSRRVLPKDQLLNRVY